MLIMKRKVITGLLCTGILLAAPVHAYAAMLPAQQATAAGSPAVMQGGLLPADIFGAITRYTAQLSAGYGCIYMNASTISNTVMKKIGLKNVTLQYSVNGVSWIDAVYYGGIMNNNTTFFSVSGKYYPAVLGSGYYRVKVTHYAYTTINSTQSVVEISNAVWIN